MFDNGIVVVGLGYIGLPTSAAIATQGVSVIGIDVRQDVVDAINLGKVPIVEPDLDVAVAGAVALGTLRATTEVPPADVFMLAVPTPSDTGKAPDLSYVKAAAEALAPVLKPGDIVILESTSPPGTTRRVSEWIAAVRPDLSLPHEGEGPHDIYVAHCPERVLPGRIMVEIVENDRLVGGITPACAERAAEVYALFCRGEIVLTDATTAEMAKLVENSFRDVNIAFANELAGICEHLDLDVWEVIELANKHPRVNILKPGPGVGGHCIAVDPWFIVAAAPDQSRIIRTAREVNDARPHAVVAQTISLAEPDSTIAVLGLAFKANVDDLRESPAIQIVELLDGALPDAQLLAVEPHVDALPPSLAGRDSVSLVPLGPALAAADVVLLLVDHQAFMDLTLDDLRDKQVVDTRGLLKAATHPLERTS